MAITELGYLSYEISDDGKTVCGKYLNLGDGGAVYLETGFNPTSVDVFTDNATDDSYHWDLSMPDGSYLSGGSDYTTTNGFTVIDQGSPRLAAGVQLLSADTALSGVTTLPAERSVHGVLLGTDVSGAAFAYVTVVARH